jgi:hypothetical protein
MLFDLRSRGRRRTVQAVYLGLALLMGGGLVLFGVGAGNGFGGILNAFTGNGSGNDQTQVVSQAEKDALKATRLRPSDPSAWAAVVQARYASAGQGNDYNPNLVNSDGSTGAYTSAGKKELGAATTAWQHYLALTKTPDTNLAQLVARAYDILGQYAQEAATWQVVTAANPTSATYFEYLAATAYKAKQTRVGDLASAKAISLTPKAQQATVAQQLQQAATAAGVKASLPATATTSTSTSTTTTPVKAKTKTKK